MLNLFPDSLFYFRRGERRKSLFLSFFVVHLEATNEEDDDIPFVSRRNCTENIFFFFQKSSSFRGRFVVVRTFGSNCD